MIFIIRRPQRSSFFFNATGFTEIYTLAVHHAHPIPRYPDSFVCKDEEVADKTTTSDDWCARYPDSFVCQEEVAAGQTSTEDWCSRYPDSFVCKAEAPVPAISAYVVQAGDHLWGISSQPKVYGDPYQWPLLFKRNRADISDADLIYPGQMIQIRKKKKKKKDKENKEQKK